MQRNDDICEDGVRKTSNAKGGWRFDTITVAARLFLRPPPPPLLVIPFPTSLMAAITQFPMPPATADLATTWTFLEEGVDHIMTKLHTGVSYTKYMNLYTVSYNYCTSSKMHSTISSEQSVAGRCLSLFTSQPPYADIFPSWCQSDGFRFVQ